MSFIDQDDVEKVFSQLCEPLIFLSLKLVNVCDYNICLIDDTGENLVSE
jgi:hypothetical protein